MTTTAEQIKKAWDFRLSQNFEDCRTSIAQIKQELKIPVGLLNPQQVLQIIESAPSSDLENSIQALLLAASLMRSDGQLTLSQQILETIESSISKRNIESPFQLFFQKAINYVANRDYSAALEVFLTSRIHTKLIEEKIYALSNAMFCLDNLGLSFEKTKSEIEKLMKELPEQKSNYFQQSLEQLHAFETRIKFRYGKFGDIFNHPNTAVTFGQSEYLKTWIKMLPYHTYHMPFEELQLEDLSLANPYFYKKSYRLRTLQGLMHQQDNTDYNVTEFADRLYLWTWRWLVFPNQFPITRLLALINSVDFSELSHFLTDEDFHLVRNSLYWISLFDPTSFEKVEKLTASLRPHQGRSYDLLSFENDFQTYLFALRDHRNIEAQDFLANLKQHPLWGNTDLLFSVVIKYLNQDVSVISKPLQSLAINLSKIIKSKQENATTSADIVIDTSSDRIYDAKTKETVTSEPMCRGFEILHRKGSVMCEEFLLATFGLHNYDALMHDQKIFNLLARMRGYKLENLKLGVKAGKVFAIGSWKDIQFIRPLLDEYRVDNRIEWQSLVSSNIIKKADKEETLQKWIKPNLLLKKLCGKPEFTREDVEKLAGTSRSTANRLIKTWLDQGFLDKKGNARNTVYFLNEKNKIRGISENNI